MRSVTKDYYDVIQDESYYISVQLFQFENPEKAYEKIIKIVQNESLSDRYREGDYIIELSCIGLNELDLLQTNIEELNRDLKTLDYGIDITSLDLDTPKEKILKLVKSKEDLKLFDKYYNYKQ